MAEVTITLKDTPAGGVSIHSDFKPAVGAPCSAAQAVALDIVARTAKEYGLRPGVLPDRVMRVVNPTGRDQ